MTETIAPAERAGDSSTNHVTTETLAKSALPSFKDGRYYRVSLKEPVPLAGQVLRPDEDHTMTGEFARSIKDSILGAALLEAAP